MIEITAWAREILAKADSGARRFNPDARVRLARRGETVEAVLTDAASPGDQSLDVDGATVFVEAGLEGLVDVEEPHDRLVLRPPGSTPNVKPEH